LRKPFLLQLLPLSLIWCILIMLLYHIKEMIMSLLYLDKRLWDIIETRKNELDSLRPLPAVAVRKLREQFEIEMTYNSNGIEGNSLTLKETFLVINEGITVKNKPLKDHLEARGHKEALDYLVELIDEKKKISFNERIIVELHYLISKDIEKEWAGKYRISSVVIGGAKHKPVDALFVKEEMKKLINWYRKESKRMNIIELIALLQHKLVYVHPFFDGNGRTSRLLMNLLFLQEGYPIITILKNDRRKYYRLLQEADGGVYAPFVTFIAQAAIRSLDMYLDIMKPIGMKKEKFLTLSKLAENGPYAEKYLNLLARKGKIEAHKEGRVWLASKEAIKRYISQRERNRKI
jgi:cell filamentation protein, protein adenylyltransferase